jgi:hypothetical protein
MFRLFHIGVTRESTLYTTGITSPRVRDLGVYSSRVELNIECSSLAHLSLFRTQVELELIIELDILFKLGSFIFRMNSSLFTSGSINLLISYIK